MRQILVNGQTIWVPEDQASGQDIKQHSGVSLDRQLIRRGSSGSQLIGDNDVIPLSDGDYFTDFPIHEYGD